MCPTDATLRSFTRGMTKDNGTRAGERKPSESPGQAFRGTPLATLVTRRNVDHTWALHWFAVAESQERSHE